MRTNRDTAADPPSEWVRRADLARWVTRGIVGVTALASLLIGIGLVRLGDAEHPRGGGLHPGHTRTVQTPSGTAPGTPARP